MISPHVRLKAINGHYGQGDPSSAAQTEADVSLAEYWVNKRCGKRGGATQNQQRLLKNSLSPTN